MFVWGGGRIEDVGLRKKKGFLGRVLLSSAIWSLYGMISRGGGGRVWARTHSCDLCTSLCERWT